MNVIIKINNGREAIPVRALPFLSDRKTLSPDVVAKALAGTEENGRFVGLCAYRMEHGMVMPIADRWWQTGPCQTLDALSAVISAEECPGEHETEDEYIKRHARELAKWRDKSPGLLPAGVFVYKDDLEQIYRNEFKFNHYHFKGKDGKELSERNHNKRITLDYSPFFDDSTTATLVMAGFESYIAPDAVATNTHEQHSIDASTNQRVAILPVSPEVIAPAHTTETPAPVEPAKAGPVGGLLTKEIAESFDGVNGWNVQRWRSNLSGSQWLHTARIAVGAAGGASAVWNPLTLAQLVHRDAKSDKDREQVMKVFNSRFTHYPVLMPWREAFNEYFATHCATD